MAPILTVTKVTKNWKNKLASATCLRVCVAAGGFEFPQDITTFSDFQAESEVTEVCVRA